MAGTDLQALLEKQAVLSAGVTRAEKLAKEAAYHSKQATRKTAEAAELSKANAALQAELDAVTGKQAAPAKEPAKK